MFGARVVALLLALATVAVFLPVARHDFVNCDDDVYVTGNAMVQQGLTAAGIKWAFTTFHGANWHPLTWLSHMADCQLFGLNAGAQHLMNVAFHAANTVLVFWLMRRVLGSIAPAAFAAALFGWHPLHVESVAWVAERKDVLSTFFGLLSLLAYVRRAQGPPEEAGRQLRLSVIFFALSLLAKPMLVTLPFVLLLLDFWPLKRLSAGYLFGPVMEEKIPFFVLTAASCVVTFFAQRAGEAVISLQALPLHYRLANAAAALAEYLCKLVWPVNLAMLYPYHPISAGELALALAVLAMITGGAWLARRKQPYWLVGWLWFVGTLVPVIGVVQVGAASMADRYTYFPSIGIFMAVALGLRAISWGDKFYPVLAMVPLIACTAVTEQQLGYWQNSETLFRHSAEVTQNNESALIDLGSTLDAQGLYSDAAAAYREALQINSGNFHVHLAFGKVLARMGRLEPALEEFHACQALAPDLSAAHYTAGGVLLTLGRLDEASAEYARASELATNEPEPHLELAKIGFLQGDDAKALGELRAAVRVQPDDYRCLMAVAHYLAASTNDAVRDPQNALVLAVKANDLSGNEQPEVLDVLGMAFAANARFTNAMDCASNALRYASATNAEAIQHRLDLYKQNEVWTESFRGMDSGGIDF